MTKPVRWMGASRRDLTGFPSGARADAGFQLWMVQSGEPPLDWKPVHAVGPGVMEIRIHRRGEFRVLYVARFREAIYVLHCFRKKTRKTSPGDLESSTTLLGGRHVANRGRSRMMGRRTKRFEKSSGNVFLDIGFPAHEAQHLRVRAELMAELIRIVRSRRLTQAAASKLFRVSQPRVSDLMTGKIDRFSIDALVEMLWRSGRRVEIAAKRARRVA